MRDNLQLLLSEHARYRAVAAETSEQALELALNEEFDVVISDLNRPGKDGFEFLKAYKIAHPLTPVIILSGTVLGVYERRAYKLGAFRCLSKPQKPGTIISVVREALKHRKVETDRAKVAIPPG